jgi:putative ABC transport system permease protein
MRELRLAFRALRRQAGFSFVALATLTLGIGATTAIFSVVDTVLLRPLPFGDPARVVAVRERAPSFPNPISLSVLNFPDLRDQAASFTRVGAVRSFTLILTGGGEPLRLDAKMMSADLLETLRVEPSLGRAFRAEDDAPGAAAVALVSDSLWKSRLNGSPDALGKTLQLDGRPVVVVGVLPTSFRLFQPADVYVPLGPWLATQPQDRTWHPGLVGLARLKPGVSIESAQREADGIAAQLERAYPDSNLNIRFLVTPARDVLVQGVRDALFVLLGAVGGVLLIACGNVAGLQLARGVARQREFAVRTALGGGTWSIARSVLAESVLLGLGGAVGGLLLAFNLLPLLLHLVGPTLPRAEEVTIDGRVLAFTFLVGVLTPILSGLVPAFAASRVDIRDALSEAGRGAAGGTRHRRARTALVVIEVAMTLALLVGAGLLLRSFARLQQVSPGFDPDRLLVADVPLSPRTYATNEARQAAVDRLVSRAASLPGASGAAVTTVLPVSGPGASIHFNVQGRPPRSARDWIMANQRAVSRGYLALMRIPIVRGRGFSDADREGGLPVAIVNEAFAQQFFPGGDPIGQRFSWGTEFDGTLPWLTIVGICGNVLQSPDADARAEAYVPYEQYPDDFFAPAYRNVKLVVRGAGDPASLAPPLRQMIRGLDANQPVVNVRTMDAVMDVAVAQPKFRSVLLGSFAAIALLLAAVGLYGLMAHGVAERQREFGVRLALGAAPESVRRLVVREGLRLAGIGLGAGALLAVALARVLSAVLFTVTIWDPIAWTTAAASLVFGALLATWIPARRAVLVDPAVALRVG